MKYIFKNTSLLQAFKMILVIFTLISIQSVSAQARKPADVESSVSVLSTVTKENITDKTNDILHAVDSFTTFHKLTEKDIKSITLVLKTLALTDTVDTFDPARDTAYSLSESYLQNKGLYNKALLPLNSKEKKMWKEVFTTIEERARTKTKGNG